MRVALWFLLWLNIVSAVVNFGFFAVGEEVRWFNLTTGVINVGVAFYLFWVLGETEES